MEKKKKTIGADITHINNSHRGPGPGPKTRITQATVVRLVVVVNRVVSSGLVSLFLPRPRYPWWKLGFFFPLYNFGNQCSGRVQEESPIPESWFCAGRQLGECFTSVVLDEEPRISHVAHISGLCQRTPTLGDVTGDGTPALRQK